MAEPTFDPERAFVTSYVLTPTVLAGIRLVLGLFTLTTLLFSIIWQGVKLDTANSFFSYFTNLTYIGLCAYFFASGVQTFVYAGRASRTDGSAVYPLQGWHRALQFLHKLLYTTIVSFPLLVTVVYWALLASSASFKTPFDSYNNISKHALNTVFALFELTLTNIGPLPWLHLPITILFLGGYLGVAYITHDTLGIYPYAFLDPKKGAGRLAAYIVGIAVGQIVFFLLAWGIIRLRVFLLAKHAQGNANTAALPAKTSTETEKTEA